MARRGGSKAQPSFFAFVSVLIALIGVLIFIVLTLTVTAVKPKLVVESPVEYNEVDEEFFKRINVVIEFVDGGVFLRASDFELVDFIDTEFDANKEWDYIQKIYGDFSYERHTAWQGTNFLDFINDMAKNKHKTHFMTFLLRETGITEYSLMSDLINRRNSMVFDEVKHPGVNDNWEAAWSLVYLRSDRVLEVR